MKSVFNGLVLLVHLTILALSCLMLLNAVVPPRSFPYLNLIPLIFPMLIIAYGLLTLYWIVLWKKRGLFFLLMFLLFFLPIRRWLNYSTPQAAVNDSFKVMSFNIRNYEDSDKETIAQYISAQEPDVVLLQEATASTNLTKHFKHEIEFPIVRLLTQFPVLESGNIDPAKNGHSFYADLDANGKTIRFINIYLEPFYLEKEMVKPSRDMATNEKKAKRLTVRFFKSFRAHQDQIAEIGKFIKDSPHPVIVSGDFNSVPNSYEYYKLSDGLQDGFLQAGNGLGTSFHDYKYPIRIDYIFASPQLRFHSYRTDRSRRLSDHFAVIAKISLQGKE